MQDRFLLLFPLLSGRFPFAMSAKKKEKTVQDPKAPFDPVALGRIMAESFQKMGPLLQDYMKENGPLPLNTTSSPLNIQDSYAAFMKALMSDPQKLIKLQTDYWTQWMGLWQNALLRAKGEPVSDLYKPGAGDRRFRDESWESTLLFDFIKQSYLMTKDWMLESLHETEGMSPEEMKRLDFYTRQVTDAMAPSNFLLTNPEVLEETLKTGGENLVRGFQNLLEDMARGKGQINISTTDEDAFEIGRNIAATKGRVIFQNDLMQLIQYAPQTEKVFKRPLLIVPPWINKYYILDLTPENSLVNWLVRQGHTVFMISWVNPGPNMSQTRFEDYMQAGVIESLRQIKKATGEKDVNAIGYCIGGTLLAMTLAWMAEKREKEKIVSATFFTTLIDFEKAGELKLFIGEDQLNDINRKMEKTGLMEGKTLQRTFSALRANDLIWSFVINNYLMGKEPFPFDLLYWNNDSTNMPKAMFSFYLRKMYIENALVRPDGIRMDETPLDISKIKTPSYFLSTFEDHIAPWQATYDGARLFSGPVTFVLSGSGHVNGVVNPPAKNKYGYETSGTLLKNAEDWMKNTKKAKGSWWPHWQKWVKDFTGPEVEARKPAKGIEPAPGSYVKKKI